MLRLLRRAVHQLKLLPKVDTISYLCALGLKIDLIFQALKQTLNLTLMVIEREMKEKERRADRHLTFPILRCLLSTPCTKGGGGGGGGN